MKLAPTPKMPLNFSFVLVAIAYGAAVVEAVSATNDWSRPCFDGECAYDLPSHGDSALGAFKIVRLFLLDSTELQPKHAIPRALTERFAKSNHGYHTCCGMDHTGL